MQRGAGTRGRGGARPSPARAPAFRVVVPAAGAHGSAADEEAPPVAQSARRADTADHDNDHGGDAPVTTRGGRGGRGGNNNNSRSASGSGVGGGLGGARGRGGGVFASRGRASGFPSRGGGGRGRGSGRGGVPDRGRGRGRGQDPSSAAAAAVKTPAAAPVVAPTGGVPQPLQSRHVETITTESGSELPMKMNSKVFIDGLPFHYEETPGKPTLEDELMQFATAWKVGRPLRLIKKPGQGFGFLLFKSPNSVPTAVRVLNGRKFLGRALRVEVPKPKDLEKMGDVAGMRDVGKDSFSRQVLLSDLAKIAAPEMIREVLRDVAPALEKKLESIKMTSRNRKAFLTFDTEEDAVSAVTFLDGFQFFGRKVAAARAAAPGSLPYSRSGGGKVVAPAAPAGATATTSAAAAAATDDDGLIVPLGAEDSPARPPRRTATPAVTAALPPAAAAAGNAKASNITGQTARYNLLDKGPREVYVGNLEPHVTAGQLAQHLSTCGKITRCELLVHPETHQLTGIAVVEFALPAYAAYAQTHFHGSRLQGCTLRIDRGDEASPALGAEGADKAEEDEEVYDEDGYLAKYGVTDKKAYFKGTSVAKEMGATESFSSDEDDDGSDDDDDEVQDARRSKKGAKRPREERRSSSATAGVKRPKKDDADLVISSMFDAGDDDDDNDDDEHFYDVDDVKVRDDADHDKRPKKKKAGKSGGGGHLSGKEGMKKKVVGGGGVKNNNHNNNNKKASHAPMKKSGKPMKKK